jgi:hypothetical protein
VNLLLDVPGFGAGVHGRCVFYNERYACCSDKLAVAPLSTRHEHHLTRLKMAMPNAHQPPSLPERIYAHLRTAAGDARSR